MICQSQSYVPVIKVYNIDYDFIISNYLDVRLWTQIWTLFTYKDINITICLNAIETKINTISFEITLANKGLKFTRVIRHNLNNSTIYILKNQIKGAMEHLINELEYSLIRLTPEYNSMQSIVDEEKNILYDTASKFLDDNGVRNSEIRSVYIDNYIYSYSQADSLLSSYLYGRKYTELTDLFLIFADITQNDILITNVKKANDPIKIQNIIKDLTEYKKFMQTEDFMAELNDNLDSI